MARVSHDNEHHMKELPHKMPCYRDSAADARRMQEETTTADVKPIISGLWLVTSIMMQAAVFGMMAWTIPQFAKMYQDLMPDEPLPGLTAVFLGGRPSWCIVLMAIMIFALVMKERLLSRRRARAWTSVGFAGAAVFVFVVYIIAVLKPLAGYTGGGLGV